MKFTMKEVTVEKAGDLWLKYIPDDIVRKLCPKDVTKHNHGEILEFLEELMKDLKKVTKKVKDMK